MNGKLWGDVTFSPDGEQYFGNGESDETRRAKARDERHAARPEVKHTQAAKPGTDEAVEPIVVNAK